MNEIKTKDENKKIMHFDKDVFSIDAILKTTYKYSDKYYFQLDEENNSYQVSVKPRSDLHVDNNFIDEFSNELIDQQLRCELNKSNHDIKEMIIRKAFPPFEKDINEQSE